MANVINSNPFLKTSRNWPTDAENLSQELDKSYIEIAQVVNARTIGLFPTNRAAITGNNYFITSTRQQTLRQVFSFNTTASITHNILNINPANFINCFGSYTDGTNGYGLFFASSVAIAGQITFYLTPTQIIFLTGAGAPTLTSGLIVLEWLSNP